VWQNNFITLLGVMLNFANDASEHALNLPTAFNMGKVTQRKK